MAKKITIGAGIALDGEKEYRQAITGINSDMKVLQSEMKSVSTAFSDNANSVEALTKKDKLLNDQVDKQKEKLEALKLALQNSEKQYGENDTRTDKWKISLNNAEAELSKLDRELTKNNAYLDEAKRSTDKTANSIDKFGKEVDSANKKTSVFGDVLKANLIGNAVSDGISQLGGAIKDTLGDSIKLASDLSEVQNVVDTTFGSNKDTINEWSSTMAESYGISELSAKKYSGVLGAMLKSMQLTDAETLKMSQSMTELAGDMASFYNLSTDEAFEKIRSGISGETEPLKQLGINLSVANLEAFALAEGVTKTYKAMSQAEQSTLRYNYLMKTTADSQGDFAKTSDSFANQQRILTLEFDNFKTKIGQEVVPELTEGFGKINDKLRESGDDIAELVGGGLSALTEGFVWMIDNSDLVAAGLSGIGAAMITSAAANVVKDVAVGFQALTVATEGATVAQTAFNVAQKANLIALAATAAVGLTAAFIVYNKQQEETIVYYEEMKKKTDALTKGNKELQEEITNSASAYSENKGEIEGNYQAVQILSDKLYGLSDKEQKSNSEKLQMQALVNQLNESIPNLNLAIDAQTGALSRQQTEVNGLIVSMKQQAIEQVNQERYLEIARQQASAQDEITQATENLSVAQAEYNALKLDEIDIPIADPEAWNKLTDAQEERIRRGAELEGYMSEENKTIADQTKAIADCEDQFNALDTTLGEVTDSTNEQASATAAANSSIQDNLAKTEKAYKDAKKTAKDSIQSQIDVFDKFDGKVEKTKETLLANLKSQAEGVQNWADNLDTLSKNGLDEGILKHLREMGPSAAKEVAALSEMTAPEIKAYEKQWKKLGEATADAAADSTKELKEQYSDAKTESVKAMSDTATEMKKIIGYQIPEIGKNIPLGIIDGIKITKGQAINSGSVLIHDMFTAMKRAAEIKSPSKRAKKEVGEQLGQGVIDGVEAKKANAKKTAKELSELILEAAQKKLDNYKVYNDMSLEEEVAYWDKIRKATKKGTQSRIDADKEYFEAKKSLADEETDILEKQTEAQKDYSENIKKINEDLAKDIEDIQNDSKEKRADLLDRQYELEKEYAENCKKVNDDLKNNIDDLNDKYNDSVASRTESIAKSMGLFEEYAKNSANKKDLIFALETQVGGLEDWSNGLEDLRTRGVDTGLVKELQDLGVKSAGEVEAINSMTDEELTKYVNLWKDKNALAKNEALTELEGLRVETDKEIKKLEKAAETTLADYKTQLIKDAAGISLQLAELYSNTEKQIADARVKSAQEIAEYAQAYTETLSSLIPKAKEIGGNIADGIIAGMKSRKSAVNKEMASLVSDSIEAAKKAGEINSPSKKSARLVGSPLGQGVAVGIGDQADLVNSAMSSLTDFSVGSVNMGSLSMPNVSGLTNNTVSNRNVVNLSIYPQSLTEAALDMTFNYINRRFGEATV